MGRNPKVGLSYFPLDTDFFDDEKILFTVSRFGVKCEGIIVRLMCRIYRNGYYLEFNDDMALLVARSVGDVSLHGLVTDVVHELVKRGFFNKDMFDRFSILTSRGFQKRYFKICSDSHRVSFAIHPQYDLISFPTQETQFPLEEIANPTEESAQTKGKERKEKESKEGTARDTVSSPVNGRVTEKDFEEIWKLYPNSQGKKNARRHFFASVKTAADMERIKKALDNYQLSKNFKKGFIKNGSTWFNEWDDWVDPKPAMMEDPAANQPPGPGFIDFRQQRKEAERKRFLGEQ
jgi:hypothetical protein